MMDFRQRLEQNKTRPVNSEAPVDPDEQLSFAYFAADRTGSPACLDLRTSNGSRRAIPYSYFTEISYEPEKGIEISTTGKRIRISGRNLATLYDYLIAYRVRYVQANIGSDTNEGGVFVKEIVIEDCDGS